MPDFVIAVATPAEGDGIPRNIGRKSISVVVTGVGLVNAAIALTRFLSANPASVVISCGIGGAYPGSGLDVGDVVCADSEIYGDLGADSSDGFLDLPALGFSVMPTVEGARLSLDCFPAPRRVPFVSCATATGTDERAALIVQRTGAAVESMEGAAIVQVAKTFGVRVGEIRGISNRAGRRDRASWRIPEASAAARQALLAWIEETAC